MLWNVIATPELSLEPRQWCFPDRGLRELPRLFRREPAAQGEATKFAAAGDDVHIGGVPAFSTLGYFNDPILSTFIRYPDPELARLIFHELAHQVAYAKDDSVFNESFAVAVEEEGVARWLATQNDPALAAQFESSQRYREGFRALVDAHARAARGALRQRCERRGQARRQGGRVRGDARRLRGAQAISGAAPAATTPGSRRDRPTPAWPRSRSTRARCREFQALLAAEGGDLPRFYARVKELATHAQGRTRPASWRRRGIGGRVAGAAP